MFFLIGGVQPKTVTLGKQPEACPYCSRFSVHTKRTDHYLSLFFIPLFPIKRGQPFIECDHCRALLSQDGTIHEPGYGQAGAVARCRHCKRPLEPEFSFCPACGKRV